MQNVFATNKMKVLSQTVSGALSKSVTVIKINEVSPKLWVNLAVLLPLQWKEMSQNLI